VHNEHIEEVKGHTNIIHIQAANPNTNFHYLLDHHPTAPFILDFGAYHMKHLNGQKIFYTDSDRVNEILNAVEDLIRPHKHRAYAFLIMDEIETNPQSIQTLNYIVHEIKQRPLLADIKLWVNFDNIYSHYTGTPLVIPHGIDLVSLTPNYGCLSNLICERHRYRHLLPQVQEYNNNNPGKPLSLVVIGDSWSNHSIGINHIDKSDIYYDEVKKIADIHNISIVGQLVFAYSFPQQTVVTNWILQDKWKDIGTRFISGNNIPVVSNPVVSNPVVSNPVVSNPVVSNPVPSISTPTIRCYLE
jgi:hypothetical protein